MDVKKIASCSLSEQISFTIHQIHGIPRSAKLSSSHKQPLTFKGTKMKKLILALSLLPLISFARPLDTIEKAKQVMDQLLETVSRIHGVNSIGITGCDPRTGEPNIFTDYIHCVQITTETVAAENYLLRMFPPGKKINGVYISVKYIGVIAPQPRMGVGR